MKFNKLIPELTVSNINKSLKFYTKIIGFKIEYERKEQKFAFLSFQGSQIMIEEAGASSWTTAELKHPFGRGTHLQIEVNDIGPILKSLKKNKISLFLDQHEKWYRKDKKLLGNKQFLVQDPDGYLLRFFERIGKKKVNSFLV